MDIASPMKPNVMTQVDYSKRRHQPEKDDVELSAAGQALLAYKLNWQSVMFVGYGDDRELLDQRHLARLDRQVFVKLSYAFQR